MIRKANSARRRFRLKASPVRGIRLSEVANHIPQSDVQRLGDFQQRIDGDGPVRTFDLADVNRMQIGLLGQFFLAQACPFPMKTNFIADQFAVFGDGSHGPLQHRKQRQNAISCQLKFICLPPNQRPLE